MVVEESELVDKLLGQWISSTLGLVQVRRKTGPGDQGRPSVLEVWEGRGGDSHGQGPCRPRAHVKLRSRREPELPEIGLVWDPGQGRGPHGERSLWFLDSEHSTTTRVRWVQQDATQEEVWDGAFLPTLRKAAVWARHHALQPQLDEAWMHLQDPSKSTQPLPYSVGICTATMNRLWQLRRALPLTLMHCWPYRKSCCVHVVDLGSKDSSLRFLLERCRFAMECGLLRVYKAEEKFWHASVGKNTAHAVADQHILVNVDSDNLIGASFLEDVCERFKDGAAVAQYEHGQGTCGRIAAKRSDFMEIGGYDEDAYPMGCQDTDLVLRLKELGRGHHSKGGSAALSQAILNTTEQKVEHCDPVLELKKWGQMNESNRRVFHQRRTEGKLKRNENKARIGVPAKHYFYKDGILSKSVLNGDADQPETC